MTKPYSKEFVLERLVFLTKELGKFPRCAERQIKARSDQDFPTSETFECLGQKRELMAQVIEYCEKRGGWSLK
jgi:hypothetical protein